MFEPERKFVSDYRLKPPPSDKNEVSISKLRKTIVMVLEKSRARAKKNFPAQLVEKRKDLILLS